MELIDIFRNRRSVRKYTDGKITDEQLNQVLEAGLLSASGKAIRPWEMIVVRDKETMKKMSGCREGSGKMLESADAAIVVIADQGKSDVWIEDCSVVMGYMHLMASSLGLGSCWIQGRLRNAVDGQTTEEYLRGILGYPEGYKLEATLVLGVPAEHPAAHSLSDIQEGKVHYEKY